MNDTRLTMTLDQLDASMELASDVLDANGGVLVSAGTQLTDKLIQVLRRREVESVVVVDSDSQNEEQCLSRRQRVEQRLEAQYAGFDSPVMGQLKSLFRRYHTRGMR